MLNIQKARDDMEKAGLDALIALSLTNVYYSTGYWSQFSYLVKEHIRPVVIPRDKKLEPFVICPDHEVEDFKTFSQIKNFVVVPTEVFVRFTPGSGDRRAEATENMKKVDLSPLTKIAFHTMLVRRSLLFLTQAMKERGLHNAILGTDSSSLISAEMWEELKRALPYATLVEAGEIFHNLRIIKTTQELEYISEATKLTERAIQTVANMLKEGVRHSEVVSIVKKTMTDTYSEPYELSIDVLGAPATAFTEEKIEKGNILLCDVGAKYKNYCCDVSRNFSIGKPAVEIQKIYDATRAAQEKMISMLKPGVKFSDVFRVGMDIVKKVDPDYRRGHLGHNLGIEIHERPYFSAIETAVLEPGMAITLEVPYYWWKNYGINLEDTIIITDNGCRFAGTPGGLSRDLIVK